MAKFIFNNKNYNIDDSAIAPAMTALEAHLRTMAGGAEPEPDVPVEPTIAAGLYETGTENLIKSWDELVADGIVHVDNGVVYTDLDDNEWVNAASEALAGDLVLPSDGSITAIGDVVYDEDWNFIGRHGFCACEKLTGAIIPNSVTSISLQAFAWCTSLTSVIIPNSVISIGEEAFCDCTSLTSVEIPNSVTSIGDFAFAGIDNLEYTIKDGLKYLGNKDNPYLYLGGTISTDITSAEIDEKCRFICNDAFNDHSNLERVEIPDSVTSIGQNAFRYCNSLTSVVIPDSVTVINYEAFYGCGLTSIIIPNSVTSIGDRAFDVCLDLTSVVIGDGVTSIGYMTFADCRSLTSVVIPDSVTSIGEQAFAYCESLTSVVIPEEVVSIGENAFYDCDGLTSVYYKGTEEQWNAITVDSSGNEALTNATIHYNYVQEN